MNNILQYFNINSGAISGIATIILVAITGWYAYLTRRILRSNEKANIELLRPYVIAHLLSEDYWLKLKIKNIGKRPATNVIISFVPDLDCIDRLVANSNKWTSHKPLLKQNFIPPEFEISTTLMFEPDFVKNDDLNRNFTVNLTYQDMNELSIKKNILLIYQVIYMEKKLLNSLIIIILKI